MTPDDGDDFFIGYINAAPGSLKWFLPLVAIVLLSIFAGTGFLISAGQSNAGEGRFLWGAGAQKLTGILEARPYPIVHVEPVGRFPEGRTIFLSGQGKRGVQDQAGALDGKRVSLEGVLLKRGDLDMLQVGKLEAAADGAGASPSKSRTTDLGRWRLTGEICDGKCEAGAMRPGRGLSHKACANLCLIGGAPPVFVSTGKVSERDFFLLADADGNPLPEGILDYVALRLEAEGRIEQRGDMLIFKMDLTTLKKL